MPEFFNVRPPKQALDDLLPHVAPVVGVEKVATADALGSPCMPRWQIRLTSKCFLLATSMP